ncbi:MAG: DUF4139 domain-containing protein, partial [Planctomycetota bacterium]
IMKAMTVFALLLAIIGIPVTSAEDNPDLEVTRVALFNSGVGYFEREASLTDNANAELSFRTNQINDILKSMVVQDFDGGTIGVVSYASRDPIEKMLSSFGVDLTGKPTLGKLLDQLRGEPVEIAGPRRLEGVIVGVEKQPQVSPDGRIIQEIERLTILTETGLQHVVLTEMQGIRLTNAKVDSELRKALAALAMAHDADKKSVVLRFEGQGQRRVRVAYLLETPIWKTSYRLLLSEDEAPMLQGWATVENATEEDWNNVRLSLVSGRPISFRMDLYTPIYIERPLEQLDLYASLRPPDYDAGMNFAGKGVAGERGVARRRGGAMAGVAMAPASPEPEGMEMDREELSLSGAGVESVALAQEAGELFEYAIRSPVSIPRQHSAMLPIVNDSITGDKISIYNPATHPKHPLNGLELTNATDLNLMQGPVTVFDGDIYAGDAKLPDLKPGEKRLISYALDLGMEVIVKQQPTPEQLISLRIAKGVLWRRQKYLDQREYLINNKTDRLRTMLLEQRYDTDWKLIEPAESYEQTRNLLRFKVPVPAHETLSYPVKLERIGDQSIVLSSTGLDDIRFYLRAKNISPAVEQALRKIIEMRSELSTLSQRREMLERQREEALQDQQRIRENLKTFREGTDTYQRQVVKFEARETEIEELRTAVEEARHKEQQQRQAIDQYLLTLNVE